MYLVEVRTRVAKLDSELQALASVVAAAGTDQREPAEAKLAQFRARLEQIQENVALLRDTAEAEWGEFSTEIDDAIHQLSHDMDVLRAEMEEGAEMRAHLTVA